MLEVSNLHAYYGKSHILQGVNLNVQEGEIVAVGAGARDESGKLVALDVKAGDRILFGKWSGTEVKVDGEDLLIMKESDVMGVIEGKAAPKRKAA